MIYNLKKALEKEKKKVNQLKTLYVKELESKSSLEQILKRCIEDIRQDIGTLSKNDGRKDLLSKQERSSLIEKLITDEKILTLIYDKTFYAGQKKIEIDPELLKDDSDVDDKI